MSETWIPWAEKRAPSVGGENKEGYWGIPARALDLIEFHVNHSGEGWLTFLLQFHRPGANASWGLVGARNGALYQGRPLESIPWTSGGPQNNIRGLAIEWEGKGSAMPLTPEQVATGRRLYEWTKSRLPSMGAPVLGQGFREHSELTDGATTCPSGRIQPLYDSYREDEVDENTKVDWIGDGRKRTLAEMFQHHMRRNDNREADIKALKAEIAKTQTGAGDGAHKHPKED